MMKRVNDIIIIGDSMKKHFKLIFLLFLIFSFKNVYAFTSNNKLYVCSDCDFQNLDQALSYVEEDDNANDYFIYLSDSGTYSISRNYSLTSSVSIVANSYDGDFIINGNNYTIDTVNSFDFIFDAFNVTIKDLNFNIPELYNSLNKTSVLYIRGTQVIVNHISLMNKDSSSHDMENYGFAGLEIFASSIKVIDTSISNFSMGVVLYGSIPNTAPKRMIDGFYDNPMSVIRSAPDRSELFPAEIDSCDFYDNAFSIYAYAVDLEVANTNLSSIEGCNSYIFLEDSNEYGNAIIKKVGYDYHSADPNVFVDMINDSFSHQFLYLVEDYEDGESTTSYIVSTRDSETMNIATQKEASLLDYFVHIDSDEVDEYRFTVSDSSIAKIENGKVVFLKEGEVDVIATNGNGDISYTVHFKLDNPKTSTNPKTINSLHIMFGVFVLMLIVMSSMIMKKRNI